MLEAPYLCSDNPEDAADDDAPLNPESSSAPPVVDEKEDEDDDDEPEVEEGSDTVSLAESDVSVYFESETSFTDLCRSSSVTLSAINRIIPSRTKANINRHPRHHHRVGGVAARHPMGRQVPLNRVFSAFAARARARQRR